MTNTHKSLPRTLLFAFSAALVTACSSTEAVTEPREPVVAEAPGDPAEDVARDIAELLIASDVRGADQRFRETSEFPYYREMTFSVVYAEAQEQAGAGDYPAAARLLGFLEKRYPQALSSKEALLYVMFLDRARDASPTPRTTAKMERLVTEVRALNPSPPIWIDLVSSQVALDQGEFDPAHDALARFRNRWNGSPSELRPYVEELNRYLAAPPQ